MNRQTIFHPIISDESGDARTGIALVVPGSLKKPGGGITYAVIPGTSGPDTLFDTTGDDQIDAGDGDDVITVTRGSDTVTGGTGRDRLVIDYTAASQGLSNLGGFSGSLAAGYSGIFWQGNSAFRIDFSGIEDFTFTGSNSSDGITLGDGDDIANLRDGDDFVDFGAGSNSGDGGTGEDGFSANMGAATAAIGINLVTGNATFSNFEFFGTLTTGSGNDVIVTRAINRNETINTGAGNDTITVAKGSDNVNGGADRDRLIIDYSTATQGLSNLGGFGGSLAAGYSGIYWQGNSLFRIEFAGIEDFTFTGSSSSDSITLGDGDDVANTGDSDDFVDFGAGNDSGDGGAGEDGFSANLGAVATAIGINLVTGVSATFSNFEFLGTLTTGSGNDTIVTRAINRNETINTGAGNDTITVARGSDTVNGGTDRDRLIVDYSTATQGLSNLGGFGGSLAAGYSGIYWQGNSAFRVEFSGIEDFTFTGSSSSDSITLGDGDDIANMGDSDDFVDFGAGNDSGDGGAGEDGFSANLGAVATAIGINLVTGVSATFSNFEFLGTLTTGSGNDTIVTRAINRNETINTGAGNDTITVARGSDTVNGGADRDRLIVDYSTATQGLSNLGGFGGSLAAGYSGIFWQGNSAFRVEFSGIEDFTFIGSGSNDGITLGDGNDIIDLRGGDDSVDAAGGNDLVEGGDGNDTLNGGADIDTLSYASATAGVTVSLAVATAQNTVGAGIDTVSNFENLTGSGFGDTLTGNGAVNVVTGGGGNDTIDGGAGADTMLGGTGDDSYIVDDADDVVTELSSEGTADEVRTTLATYALTANVERLTGISGAGQALTGNAAANLITGAGGNDTINGGTGADTMIGGAGNDTYYVDDTGDVVTELVGGGSDTIVAAFDYDLNTTPNVENLTFSGSAGCAGTGTAGNNVLRGGAGGDRFFGGGGTDTFYGGAGDDVYIVDSADDVVIELAGEGNDQIKSSVSYTLAEGSEVEGLRLTGVNNNTATGNSAFNKLTGNPGDNILDGGGGGDALRGGLGNDTYIIRDATDRIIEIDTTGAADIAKATVSYVLEADAWVETLMTIDDAATTAINLTGNAHTQVIRGNAGANTLTAGAGNETLYGLGGADKFVFGAAVGQDVVADFASGSDKLDLSLYFADFAAFQAATTDIGGNAVINLGGGQSVTLTGVLEAQIQSGDLILGGGGGAVPNLIGAVDVEAGDTVWAPVMRAQHFATEGMMLMPTI